MEECPICTEKVDVKYIQRHVNICLMSMEAENAMFQQLQRKRKRGCGEDRASL